MPSQQQIVGAIRAIQHERDQLARLLRRVEAAVLDKAPDGMSVAYLPAELLAEIRARID